MLLPVRPPKGDKAVRLTMKLVLLTSLLCATACASTSVPTPANDCNWVRPITWSEKDTNDTQREIFAHNLKFEKFCAK